MCACLFSSLLLNPLVDEAQRYRVNRKGYQNCLKIWFVYIRKYTRASQKDARKNCLRQYALCSTKEAKNTANNWRLFDKKQNLSEMKNLILLTCF